MDHSSSSGAREGLIESITKNVKEKTLLSYVRYLVVFSRILGSKDEEATLDERYERILYFYSSFNSSSSKSNVKEIDEMIKENELSFVSTLEGIIDVSDVC